MSASDDGDVGAVLACDVCRSLTAGSGRVGKGGFARFVRRLRAGLPAEALAKAGGAEGNQTPDLFIANEALYQLSYSPF